MTIDAETRKTLADTLRGATVEQLQVDACYHIEAAHILDLTAWPEHRQPNDELAARHRRLAALALAVAAIVEKNNADPDSLATVIRRSFEPAALAALVEAP
jgi:hypothetical protein